MRVEDFRVKFLGLKGLGLGVNLKFPRVAARRQAKRGLQLS